MHPTSKTKAATSGRPYTPLAPYREAAEPSTNAAALLWESMPAAQPGSLLPQPPHGPTASRPSSGRRGHVQRDDSDSSIAPSASLEFLDSPSSGSRGGSGSKVSAMHSVPPKLMSCLKRPCLSSMPMRVTMNPCVVLGNQHSVVGILRDDQQCLTLKAVGLDWELCAMKFVSLPAPRVPEAPSSYSLLGSSETSEEAAEAFAKLQHVDHPSLARVYQSRLCKGADGVDTLFLVREFVKESTRMPVRRVGNTFEYPPLPQADTYTCCAALAMALAHLHERGLFHGRLKPSNVLSNGRRNVSLVDYGLLPKRTVLEAPPCDSALFTEEDLLFQSPQVLRGDAYDPAANDMWGFGVLMYTALTGHPPFATPQDVIASTAPPSLPADVVETLSPRDLPDFFMQHLMVSSERERWTARDTVEMLRKAVPWEDWDGERSICMGTSPVKWERTPMTTSDSAAIPPTLRLSTRSHGPTETVGRPESRVGRRRSSYGNSFDVSLLVDADAPTAVRRSASGVSPFQSLPTPRARGGGLDEGNVSLTRDSSPTRDNSPLAVSSVYSMGVDAMPNGAPAPSVSGRAYAGSGVRTYLIEASAPIVALTSIASPHAFSPHASSPHASSPHASSPHTSSPHASSPHASSPHASSPHASSLHASSPHASSPHASSPHAFVPHRPRVGCTPATVAAIESDVRTPLLPILAAEVVHARPSGRWAPPASLSPFRGSLLAVPKPSSNATIQPHPQPPQQQSQHPVRRANTSENEPSQSLFAFAETMGTRPGDAKARQRYPRLTASPSAASSSQSHSPALNLPIGSMQIATCSPMPPLPVAAQETLARFH